MLSGNNAIATVGVKNLEKSKEFYERTLGLTTVMENDEVLAFKSGASTLFVYRSPYAASKRNRQRNGGCISSLNDLESRNDTSIAKRSRGLRESFHALVVRDVLLRR